MQGFDNFSCLFDWHVSNLSFRYGNKTRCGLSLIQNGRCVSHWSCKHAGELTIGMTVWLCKWWACQIHIRLPCMHDDTAVQNTTTGVTVSFSARSASCTSTRSVRRKLFNFVSSELKMVVKVWSTWTVLQGCKGSGNLAIKWHGYLHCRVRNLVIGAC